MSLSPCFHIAGVKCPNCARLLPPTPIADFPMPHADDIVKRINVFKGAIVQTTPLSKLQEAGEKPYLLLVPASGNNYMLAEYASLEDALAEYPNMYAANVVIAKRLSLKVQEA